MAESSIVAPRTPELEKVSVASRWLQWTVQKGFLRIQNWGSLSVDLGTREKEGKTTFCRAIVVPCDWSLIEPDRTTQSILVDVVPYLCW